MAEFMAWKASSAYFGGGSANCEKLQRPWPEDIGFEHVETSYFGFCVPEADINGEIYHWFHPKFNVASGGIYIYQGRKAGFSHAEYGDFRNFMPLPEDITDCSYPTGLTFKMTKPGQEWEIRLDNPAQQTSLRLHARAVMPPAFRPVGGHLCQALKNTGTLVLHGKEYKIDSYFTRDRSWGDPRSEKPLDLPPPGWHAGVFNDDLAFHVIAFNSPECDPALAKRYPGFENGKNLLWGYVWKNGKLLGIKSCRKQTQREDDGITPRAVELLLTDENDEQYDIRGELGARIPAPFWNSTAVLGLARWTLNGLSGHGDSQEGLYGTFVRENYRG